MSESPLFPSHTLAVDPSSPSTSSYSTSSATAATATLLQKVPPALFLLVPAFSVGLLILDISHRTQRELPLPTPRRVQAITAYALIVAFGSLSTISGALPFSRAGIPLDSRSEKVVEAFVSLLLGIPVLHLASTRPRRQSTRSSVLRILHTGTLVLTLLSATLLALFTQFLPTFGTSAPPLYISPALFLAFSVLALPRLAQALRLHSRARHSDPTSNSVHFITSSSKPSWFFRSGTSPNLKSASAGSRKRAITIHVATHRTSTSYPLSLPSPSSSNSFPLTESVSSYEQLDLATHSHSYNQHGGEIELEISLPRRDHSDRKFEQQRNWNSQRYSDHVENSPEHIGRHLNKQLGRRQGQDDKHKVELHRSSIDSSSSTLTANTDRKLDRALSFNRVLTPPLTRIRLPTIASARSSDVNLQHSNSAFNQGIIDIVPANNSSRFGNFFTGNVDNRSTRTGQTTSIRTTPSASIRHGERLQEQLRFTKTRSCLVFLIAAQVTALVAYACAVGAEVIIVGYRSSVIVQGQPQAASQGFEEPSWSTLTLKIVQTACTVLAVTGTMWAYLLHAYNAHLSPSGSTTITTDEHHTHTPHPTTTNTTTTAGTVRPPKPAGSRPDHPSSCFSTLNGTTTTTRSMNATPASAVAEVFAATTFAAPGTAPSNTVFPNDSYLVQLEPPPQARKRVDAMAGCGARTPMVPIPSLDPALHGVDLNDEDALVLAGSALGLEIRSHPPYQPQQRIQSVGCGDSLFEPDTGIEDGFQGEERRIGMDEWEQEEERVALEEEMETPFLSRSCSTASGSGGSRSFRGRKFRRASVGVFGGELHSRRDGGITADSENNNAASAYHPSGSSRSKAKSRSFDDPDIYIRRRGSLPATSSSKALFGWEFGRDPVPPEKNPRSKYPMTRVMENNFQEQQESSFLELREDYRFGKGIGLGLGSIGGCTGSGNEVEKMKRRSILGSMAPFPTPVGGDTDGVEVEKKMIERGPSCKLKKRSKSTSRPTTADSSRATSVPRTRRTSIRRARSMALAGAAAAAPTGPSTISPSKLGAFSLGRGFGLGHRRLASGSSLRPGTADSEASKASYGSVSGRGLQLRKSFKLGVGRTLGPNLTLAVGILSRTKEQKKRTSAAEESIPEGVGVDDEGEIQSIAGAKLVSESIARTTPASTILATPANSGPSSVKGRPTLAAIITSSPTLSSNANVVPATASWKSHPFLDFVEMPINMTRRRASGSSHITAVANNVEDEVVELELEMEAIRGRRGHTRKDSARLHASGLVLSSITRTPVDKVNDEKNVAGGIFQKRLALSTPPASNEWPSLPSSASSSAEVSDVEHGAGGISQKRFALSSPPVFKSEWAPQPSSASPTAGGFQYRFPMIFPHAIASSSRSASPQRGNDEPWHLYQQPSSHLQLQTNSTPSTPRGPSTMRLSAMTMGTVRNAFAGVGARMSSRMSMNSSAPSTTRSAFSEIMEDGDFMDLRDPFASPPASATLVLPTKKTLKKRASAKQGDDFLVIDVEGDGRRRMSAWGKLPMPTRSFSPAGTRSSNNSNRSSRPGARVASSHRKQKKERRVRKISTASSLGAMRGAASRGGEDDADFGIEEALLSQRLLRRLDSDGWESRA